MRAILLRPASFVLTLFVVLTISAAALALDPKQIYQNSGPAVVFILASDGTSPGNAGTGSIIRDDGLIITNAHLFTQKGSQRLSSAVTIFLKPAELTGDMRKDLASGYPGEIVTHDPALDLALVKIRKTAQPLPLLRFGNSDIAVVGDRVYAIGHPEQGGLWSLTSGVVSAFWKDYGGVMGKDLFQTDASINRGNSGGPLLNEHGHMIGINSMIARKAADGLTITAVNFSIKSNVALAWLKQKGYPLAAAPSASGAGQAQAGGQPGKLPKPASVPPPPAESASSPTAAPESGQILTEKRPYNMDELLAAEKNLEDTADEMQQLIEKLK
jgi:serine protease Do